ncbi:MAG: hypothetical protein ABIJ48_05290 [Actinomycetota bacterium]
MIPAPVTPFGDRGGLTLDAHRHNLRLWWSRGVRGFLLGGPKGKGPNIKPGERVETAAAVAAVRCRPAQSNTRSRC